MYQNTSYLYLSLDFIHITIQLVRYQGKQVRMTEFKNGYDYVFIHLFSSGNTLM